MTSGCMWCWLPSAPISASSTATRKSSPGSCLARPAMRRPTLWRGDGRPGHRLPHELRPDLVTAHELAVDDAVAGAFQVRHDAATATVDRQHGVMGAMRNE